MTPLAPDRGDLGGPDDLADRVRAWIDDDPDPEARRELERLLDDERRAVRRRGADVLVARIPDGAMDTARWLAREGAADAAIELALRGSWWWWLGGRRSEGRELLADLVATGEGRLLAPAAVAWMAVHDSATDSSAAALASGEEA